jgi:hypothetical protein
MRLPLRASRLKGRVRPQTRRGTRKTQARRRDHIRRLAKDLVGPAGQKYVLSGQDRSNNRLAVAH